MKIQILTLSLFALLSLGACEDKSNSEKAKEAIHSSANAISHSASELSDIAADEFDQAKNSSADALDKGQKSAKNAVESAQMKLDAAAQTAKDRLEDAMESIN